MKKVPTISEAEYQVMKIVWTNAPISTNEVIEKLVEISTWSPKTIQTLLSRLVKKGVLDYKKDSRVFVYTPLLKEDEYLEQESETFLNRFYDGTLNSMVVNFLEQDKLTKDNIDELKKILDESLAKAGKKHD
ncbi:MAG: BlaI/MecI/CopY family transcriptional regulator [Firmicutes bacterium HGW-Firmicutes-7]|nr:MAG: BlaI/MecI/CopY family transcriptional regulator [Firmicutes bacterium HGW-Firmicutes-7]